MRNHLAIAHLVAIGVSAATGLPGCASLLPALGAIAQGAQVLGSALDLARDGSESYFARHPHPEHEQEVQKALRRAQAAVLLLDSAVAAGKGVEKARRDALAAYDNLRVLLYELGVPGAAVPDGGAEDTSAPLPEPFELPETSALQATME